MYNWFFVVNTDTKFYDAVINLILLSNTYDMLTGYIKLFIRIPSYPSYEDPNAHSSDLSNCRIYQILSSRNIIFWQQITLIKVSYCSPPLFYFFGSLENTFSGKHTLVNLIWI